jgi:hypothetical protein
MATQSESQDIALVVPPAKDRAAVAHSSAHHYNVYNEAGFAAEPRDAEVCHGAKDRAWCVFRKGESNWRWRITAK